MSVPQIQLRGVRVHNLKNVDLDIPHGQWIALCGVSGSGKSSLAIDTLYAEGQRRYIESLSPHSRQFLEQLEKPEADRIEGIPAAIAVRAAHAVGSDRATVGTATETVEFLRLLFANLGEIVCPDCGSSVRKQDPQSVAQQLLELPEATKFQITFSVAAHDGGLEQLARLRGAGFSRVIFDGQTIELSDLANPIDDRQSATGSGELYVIVDRLTADPARLQRIRDSLETAFEQGAGTCEVFLPVGAANAALSQVRIDDHQWNKLTFSRVLKCPSCQRQFAAPQARLFNFNSPIGACEKCNGSGYVGQLDETCAVCGGARINADARSYRIGNRGFAEICEMQVNDAAEFFDSLALRPHERQRAGKIMRQIESRLTFLRQVGLSYLTLNRRLSALSSGELQRVSLASSMGSTLVNMLYVLDEPSRGLHPADVGPLTAAIKQLNDRGNTMVVVDHDESIIRSATRVIEIGPAAGAGGGQIVFDGTVCQLLESDQSLTGDYLAGRRGVATTARRRQNRGRLKLTGARGNNLQNIDVEFPLGCLCLVTGVSGSGKSSLVMETLYPAICKRKRKSVPTTLPFDDIFGDSQIDEVVMVDQTPIGRSPRSNPVTYVKAFDDIRKAFAETIDAKTRNLPAGHFSFNVDGGRCTKCKGDGQLVVDMQFLPDVYMKCDQCRGTRYRKEVLSVKYRGKHIAEVLELTANQAFPFFRGQPKVQGKLKALMDVGLDYVRLGQPATTLSSGEAQRLKLALHLNAFKTRRSLFILDEPTTGLHMNDVIKLLDCFDALLSVGHSLIVIEHNLQMMRHADWIVDLGPGAADAGGCVVATGTPENIADHPDSITGRHLKPMLEHAADEHCI